MKTEATLESLAVLINSIVPAIVVVDGHCIVVLTCVETYSRICSVAS